MVIKNIIDSIKDIEQDNAQKYNADQGDYKGIDTGLSRMADDIVNRIDFTSYLIRPSVSFGYEVRNVNDDDKKQCFKVTCTVKILSDKAIVQGEFDGKPVCPGAKFIQLNIGYLITIKSDSIYLYGGVLDENDQLDFFLNYIKEYEAEYNKIIESFDPCVTKGKENCIIKQYLENDVLCSYELFIKEVIHIFQNMKPFIDFITESLKKHTIEFQESLSDLPDI
ncbi:hypothetical protein FACS1894172_07760 [Spirochaetia bacterium]|nr:hypothetical protein FACS1894164_06160 [Spirochaetia bacterium]GHU31965.1 hypothetical protein FACS1894172_07760 [Spirochaetia bacterium]